MNSLIDLAWLVPATPMIGSLLVGLLLISFNRTINRLTKPITFLIINCIGVSTGLSFILYLRHLSGKLFDWRIHLGKFEYISSFYLGNNSSIYL